MEQIEFAQPIGSERKLSFKAMLPGGETVTKLLLSGIQINLRGGWARDIGGRIRTNSQEFARTKIVRTP